MYDRDYVKTLEREIELSGDNRFEGWRLSSERTSASEVKPPMKTEGPAEKTTQE